jgi:F0F1-type ATP synthase assembly protein I
MSDPLSKEARATRETAPAFAALSRLISATIAGAGLGWALDHWGVTQNGAGSTWGTAGGAVVGLAVFIWTAARIKSLPPGPPPPPPAP